MSASWIYFYLCTSVVLSAHELKFVHIVFSHKFYAPIQQYVNNSHYDFPEKLDYRYFLEETDDMNNKAKMDMFNLGVFIRQRYNDFLGDIYYSETMRMRTSEYILSMISGQLVDAGLWPPAEPQRWNNELNWQPIVTDYVQVHRDTLLLGTLCPSFVQEGERIFNNEVSSFITSHSLLFDHLSQQYKSPITKPSDVALIYSYLQTKIDENQTLPTWAEEIFPDGDMKNVTLFSYDLLSRTTLQKQLNGGTLLKAIINDTLKYQTDNSTRKLKLAMYSGEERNLIGVLQSMGLWSRPHIINTASSLIFEIYDNSTIDQYTVKIIYHTGVNNNNTIIDLNLPGCEEFCPIDKFIKLLEIVLPVDDEESLCQKKLSGNEGVPDSGTSLSPTFKYYVLIIVSILFIPVL